METEAERISFREMLLILDLENDTSLSLVEKSKKWNIDNLNERYQANVLIGLYSRGKMDVLDLLLQKEIDINARNKDYETLLDYVLEKGDLPFAKRLVEAGANIFQINKRGDCKLIRVFKSHHRSPKDLYLYLLELGMNPFNEKLDALEDIGETAEGEQITIETLQKWSHLSAPDNDYKTPLLNGDYELALAILKQILYRIGPLHPGVPLSSFIQETLDNYRIVLHLMGNNETASVISNILYEEHDTERYNTSDITNSLVVAALFNNEKEKLKEYCKIIRDRSNSELEIIKTYLLEYLYAMRENNNRQKTSILNRLKKYYQRSVTSYTANAICKVVLFNEDQELLESYFENHRMLIHVELKVTNLYMIYLIEKKDFTSAKLFALKLNELNKKEFLLFDYYFNQMLLKYIEELEMSAE